MTKTSTIKMPKDEVEHLIRLWFEEHKPGIEIKSIWFDVDHVSGPNFVEEGTYMFSGATVITKDKEI